MTTQLAQRVVLASGNAGKLRELHALLGGLGIELVSQRELGVSDAEETGLSFVENACSRPDMPARQQAYPR